MRQFLYCFFVLCALTSNAQKDTLNRFSENGKKEGIWKVYLDQYLNPVDSVQKAYFYAFERYDQGQIVFKFYKEKYTLNDSIAYSQPLSELGNPIVLNGTYKWFEPNGQIMKQYEFKNGFPMYYKSYQYYANDPKKCGYNEIRDWSKKYNDLAGSYYYEAFWDGKLLVVGWFKKDKKKWKLMKEKTTKNSGLILF